MIYLNPPYRGLFLFTSASYQMYRHRSVTVERSEEEKRKNTLFCHKMFSLRPVCQYGSTEGLFIILFYHQELSFYIAPFLANTASKVFTRILRSMPTLQLEIYSVSMRTTSSKSVISLRPLTCHSPVIPGLHASLAR